MKIFLVTLLAALASARLFAIDLPPSTPDFFVSPIGNDAWNGQVEKPGANNAGPFATVLRAQKAVRELRASLEKTPRRITVSFVSGIHFLKDTWTFEPQDSGSEKMPVVFTGQEGAIINGGVKLTGFKADDKGHWQLTIPEVARGEWSFTELFVNGRRCFRPRLPSESFYFVTGELHTPEKPGEKNKEKGDNRFVFADGQMNKDWRNLNDVEILTFHNWTMARMRVMEIDEPTHAVTLSSRTRKMVRGGRFLVENVAEALVNPGEWYLDNKSGVLTYIPMPGEDPQKSEVVAPRLERLVEIKGGFTKETNVSHIQFVNLAFKHCAVKFPPLGYDSPQAEVNISGAIHATGAVACSIDHCTVAQVGGYGIELAAGCKDCLVNDCDLTDLGAGGIKLGDTRYRDAAHVGELAERNTVKNCFLAYGGRHYPAAIGIWIGHSPFNVVEHNEIFDFYYSGISVGWSWGYGNSNAHHNTFAYNQVHKIGQGVLTDMGAIYTLGVSPGTTIHHNLFHDVESHDYGGWGIYYDEGSTGIVSEDNIVYNCTSASFHQHYGNENVVRNNILAFGSENQLMRTRPEEHLTLTIERNIVYFKDANLLGTNWTGGKFALDNNLYWNAGAKPILFSKLPIDEWRKKGHDEHSIIEDPLFVDPEKYDFHLKENSPASKIGFKPIDLTGVGPARARVRSDNFPRAFPPRPNVAPKPSK